MEKKQIVEALKQAKANSSKRKFKQGIDLIVTLKNLNLKKPDQQVDFFINLHYPRPKKMKICGFVGSELWDQAKETFDHVLYVDDFKNFTNKREIKKLANEYDFFVAQADIMNKVAATFGRAFGPRSKMPNPKAGCVVPSNANLKTTYEKLQSTLHIKVKQHQMFQALVGYEDTDEEIVIDNIMTIYDQLMHHLPLEKNNIKGMVLKLTMGKPVNVGETTQQKGN